MTGGSSTGVLVTDARRMPAKADSSGSAAKPSADGGGAERLNVEAAKYESGKEANETGVLAGTKDVFGGPKAGSVTTSDRVQASSAIAARATNAARAAMRPDRARFAPPQSGLSRCCHTQCVIGG